MSKVSVFNEGWIDLVFEGRNQSYGAYQLRKEDSRTTILALITGIALMGTLVAIPVVINYFKSDETVIIPADPTCPPMIIELDNTRQFVEPEKPKPVETKPVAPAPATNIATTAHNTLVATSQPVTTPIPTTATLLYTNPGSITTAGNSTGTPLGVPEGTGPATSTGTGTAPGTGTGIETSLTVDAMPIFPGGMDAFYEQVSRRFRTPETDSAKTLKVYVSFVVELDGSMSNIKVGRDPGYGMANEAIRVLKSIKTKWEPGKKKGQPVRTAYNLPITININ
ncbi:energy transducer TonB [Flavobacterium album]|uniref:Energy transducer TonB n=1 Tax=Flavobacterium album TaxID=2175091 RepID=A0A2S1QT97_9FLAO|nr:energy transducer TonB [Flavobacterium album]AWH83640.1 energy transducer TonB [Flavobacterium album]